MQIQPKHQFIISSTSNLLEGNPAWGHLLTEIDLNFLPYGDISSGFFSSKHTGIISILFLEDLIKDAVDDFSLPEKAIESFEKIAKSRISETDQPIIICLASKSRSNIISTAQRSTDLEKFHKNIIERLRTLSESSNVVYFLNLDDIFYREGSDQIYSDRNWYFSRCRFSQTGLSITAKVLARLISRINTPRKKVLVLDCDNTLWGGVIGEDGLSGLTLGEDGEGQAFVDFQRECLKLLRQGVLLVLASKNNEEEVWNVFENHTSMVLKRDDIIKAKINWSEKTKNITEVAAELDLGINSFVFWDDNPVEQNKMKAILPEVMVIDAPENVTQWPSLLSDLDCFATFEVTDEDVRKVEQYRAREKFVKASSFAEDVSSYLKSINLKPELVAISEANLSRASQMCQKTNQFNLRSKRYTSKELANQNASPNMDLFLVNLSDDYGNHGLVALFGLQYFSDNIALIDTFLMSCRVLGRKLESWILNEIFKIVKNRSVESLYVEFIDTGRNVIAEEFLVEHGFLKIDATECGKTELERRNFSVLEGDLYKIPSIEVTVPNLEIYCGN